MADLLTAPMPENEPIGEAWLLSDREDHQSVVANGPLKGTTIRELMQEDATPLLGRLAGQFPRFPLLLKFLDAKEKLSVQVHPSDAYPELLPAGESGKTEAWVILETERDSQIVAGLKPGSTADTLRQAMGNKTIANSLESFTPQIGDGIFLPAGTVHALGGVVVFEVQQNSDVTFRLYDWDRIDIKTGKMRDLQQQEALACIDYEQGKVKPVIPVSEGNGCERLFKSDHFNLWRINDTAAFEVGIEATPRVLVCLSGSGDIVHETTLYPISKGEVMLLPAVVGECFCKPQPAITLLEISLPEALPTT